MLRKTDISGSFALIHSQKALGSQKLACAIAAFSLYQGVLIADIVLYRQAQSIHYFIRCMLLHFSFRSRKSSKERIQMSGKWK